MLILYEVTLLICMRTQREKLLMEENVTKSKITVIY